MARELDDAILTLRTNHLDIGMWILKTTGDAAQVLAADALMDAHASHWFVRETIGMLRRTLARLDVSSRSLFALVEPGSCFAGTLLELALAADRAYMLQLPDTPDEAPRVHADVANFGRYPMPNGLTRLAARFYEDANAIAAVREQAGKPLDGPPPKHWPDHGRARRHRLGRRNPHRHRGTREPVARRADRPGSQPALRRPRNMETRIFGRLTAWQNWIFNRPNAVGEHGALKVFGTGNKARFDWDRV
jgi:benzoyl-CoA-dihydrodiol lyase